MGQINWIAIISCCSKFGECLWEFFRTFTITHTLCVFPCYSTWAMHHTTIYNAMHSWCQICFRISAHTIFISSHLGLHVNASLPYFLTIDMLSWYSTNICLGLLVSEEGNIILRPNSPGLISPEEIASTSPLYGSTRIFCWLHFM